MARVLSNEDILAITKALTEYSGLTVDEHRDQHDALKIFIQEYKERREFWVGIRKQVGGWLIIVILAGIGTLAYNGFVKAVGGTQQVANSSSK